MTSLTVNQRKYELDVDPATPLLWVLREKLQLTGTKFGCGMALCGACTVHLNGEAVRSCVTPLSRLAAHSVSVWGRDHDAGWVDLMALHANVDRRTRCWTDCYPVQS